MKHIIAQIKSAVAQILKFAADSGSKYAFSFSLTSVNVLSTVRYYDRCSISSRNTYVCVAGHSVGAHLAASLLHDEDWIDRMTELGYLKLLQNIILIAGVYNIAPLTDLKINDGLKLTKEEIKTYSFSKLKENRQVHGLKVIVTMGEYDTPVAINEAREYTQV
ncbi:hypothetical protein HN011_010121 [Eciton burchellii]|nr:hypothetical protein HN011_010121 [Eciton burchellii]